MKIYNLENNNLKVELIEYGASIYNIYLKINNQWQSVLSTPTNLDDFIKNDLNHGRTIGRTAGMLYKETLDQSLFSKTDENIMHGGKNGLANNKFKIINETTSLITFKTIDEGNKNGYIANLEVEVSYKLNNDKLEIKYSAKANNDTLVNLTSHPYFNLSQEKDISNHLLYVKANSYKKRSQTNINGSIISLEGDLADFRQTKKVSSILNSSGLDHVYLIQDNKEDIIQTTLKANNIILNVYSNYPAVVIYSQNRNGNIIFNNNQTLNNKHAGIAIEPQLIQGSIPILKKDEIYNHIIIYEIKQL